MNNLNTPNAATDIAIKNRTQTLASWIDIDPLSSVDQRFCTEEAMATLFYLPADTLGAEDYKVSAIRVLDNRSFAEVYDSLCEAGFKVHTDCSLQLIARAKMLGVSLRQNRKTGARYAVVKLWCVRVEINEYFIERNLHSVKNFIASDFSKPRSIHTTSVNSLVTTKEL